MLCSFADNEKIITRPLSFSCWQVWEQLRCTTNCKKKKKKAKVSRLRLTSQMGCNCLINPMFVSFYAFYYRLFSLRAVSSADLPSLGEVLCQKPFSCLNTVTPLRMWSMLSELGSTSHENDWSSVIFPACRPCRCSFTAHLFTAVFWQSAI